jgi:endonuclease III
MAPENGMRTENLDVLIETILSQNTSDANSGRAFASLKASFDSWEVVASAPVERIAQAIKSGGLSQIKAVRIKQVLEQIDKEQAVSVSIPSNDDHG